MSNLSRNSLFRVRKDKEEMSLQITSMADVFVILLVFLLKSTTTGLNVNMSSEVTIPQSTSAKAEANPTLTIEVNTHGVYLDGTSQVRFEGHYPAEVNAKQDSIPELQTALKAAREKREWLAKQGAQVPNEKEVMVVADKATPYRWIKKILFTAAMEGFTDAKLAVVRD